MVQHIRRGPAFRAWRFHFSPTFSLYILHKKHQCHSPWPDTLLDPQCVAALGIVVAIVSDDGFGGYTISWLSIAALFAFYALFEFLNAQVNRLFYSKRFFPLYRFHVEKSNMTLQYVSTPPPSSLPHLCPFSCANLDCCSWTLSNVGGIMLLVAAKMLILWGYAWYHSRAPHSLGVGVVSTPLLFHFLPPSAFFPSRVSPR